MNSTITNFGAVFILFMMMILMNTSICTAETPQRQRQNGLWVYRKGKKNFSEMKSGQKGRTKKQIKELMEHLGVDEYTLGPQKHNNAGDVSQERAKWVRAMADLLMKRKKDGTVHYYDIVQTAHAAGLHQTELSKSLNPGEDLRITKKYYSRIATEELVAKKREGGRKLPEEHVEAMQQFWLSDRICRVSPNKRCTVKRRSKKRETAETVPLFYRQFTINEAFKIFRQEHPAIKCSRTSFFKYKPANVKKPKSRQDCCPICKEARRMMPILEPMVGADMTTAQRSALQDYKFHIEIKEKRAADFKAQLENLKEGQAVIVMDFKANITLGRGAEEDSHVFFNAPQRTVFGVVAYFRKGDNKYKVWFPIISQSLMHDSITVRKMLSECVLGHSVFEHFETTSLRFWMDNAPSHFRNMETMATFEEINAGGKAVEMNFFAEYHGKSECDRQFGLMSRLYTEHAEKARTTDITTTAEYLTMYKDAIRSYGGNVIPEVGGNHEELHVIDSKKLNVAAKEFVIPGAAEFLEKLRTKKQKDADAAAEEGLEEDVVMPGKKKADKRKPRMPMPYEKRKLVFEKKTAAEVRDGKEFRLNLFYKFSFHKTSDNTLRAWLYEGSRVSDYAFEVVTETKEDYSVKLGVSSSEMPAFSNLRRVGNRRAFHEALREARE